MLSVNVVLVDVFCMDLRVFYYCEPFGILIMIKLKNLQLQVNTTRLTSLLYRTIDE